MGQCGAEGKDSGGERGDETAAVIADGESDKERQTSQQIDASLKY